MRKVDDGEKKEKRKKKEKRENNVVLRGWMLFLGTFLSIF